MLRSFDLLGPPRVVFGLGVEARAAELLAEAGARRVLLLALPHHRGGAERVAAALGRRSVGIFDALRQHVPEDLAERARAAARDARADWVLAHGGGTCVGFAKAIALTEPVRVAAIPTTYAGSERTSIWGLTGPAGKRTGRDPRVRPDLLIYDPALSRGLPRDLSLMSLFNSIAHVTGTLWAGEADDLTHAAEAAAQLARAIEALAADPGDLEARTEALYGAYLAAACIERAPLALQHRVAHALGGSFGVSHSAAHTVALPYSLAFNGRARPDALLPLRGPFGDDPPAALHDRARLLDLPHSLRDLGLGRADLPRLRDAILARDYGNPTPVTAAGLDALLDDALVGRRPSLTA